MNAIIIPNVKVIRNEYIQAKVVDFSKNADIANNVIKLNILIQNEKPNFRLKIFFAMSYEP